MSFNIDGYSLHINWQMLAFHLRLILLLISSSSGVKSEPLESSINVIWSIPSRAKSAWVVCGRIDSEILCFFLLISCLRSDSGKAEFLSLLLFPITLSAVCGRDCQLNFFWKYYIPKNIYKITLSIFIISTTTIRLNQNEAQITTVISP